MTTPRSLLAEAEMQHRNGHMEAATLLAQMAAAYALIETAEALQRLGDRPARLPTRYAGGDA